MPVRRLALPLSLILVTLAVVGVSWAMKAQCLDDGGWERGEQYQQLCYNDVTVLWHQRGLAVGAAPYLDADFEYPVVTGLFVGALAAGTHAIGGGVHGFLGLNTVAAALLAVAVLIVLRPLAGDDRRLWLWAAAPPLALYAVWNWDLLAVLFLVLGLLAHRRGRPEWAGVALGLGAAAKLFPVLAVPVLALEHLRRRDRAAALRLLAAASAAWLAVNVPLAVVTPQGWWHFYDKSIHRRGNPANTWNALQQIPGIRIPDDLLGIVVAATLLAGATVILVVGTRRLPVEQTWRLVLPITAWFLITSKVYSPQFDLWLLPMLVLLPRTAPVIAFFAVGLCTVVVEMFHLGGFDGLTPAPGPGWLALVVGLRAGVLAWIILTAVRPETYRQLETKSRASMADSESSIPSQMGSR